MNNFINIQQLSTKQLSQYYETLTKAFPHIISESDIIKKYWNRLETYFPDFQLFLIDTDGELVGFMNAIPFHFRRPLDELPEDGWDWMFAKGISDYESNKPPNFLGGLQVVVRPKYQKMGYSKQILNHAKQVIKSMKLLNLVIPIRPTKKHLFPEMSMASYLDLKDKEQVYDPWIRTHLNGGAEIIKICESSMSIKGDIPFWEIILDKPIRESGNYLLSGALMPIALDVKNNTGEYKEPNIWIKYK